MDCGGMGIGLPFHDVWRYVYTYVTVTTIGDQLCRYQYHGLQYSNGQRFCEVWLYSIWLHKPNNCTQ